MKTDALSVGLDNVGGVFRVSIPDITDTFLLIGGVRLKSRGGVSVGVPEYRFVKIFVAMSVGDGSLIYRGSDNSFCRFGFGVMGGASVVPFVNILRI